MTMEVLFVGVRVRNLELAVDWYTRLFEPDLHQVGARTPPPQAARSCRAVSRFARQGQR
jgi:hypothetical protein